MIVTYLTLPVRHRTILLAKSEGYSWRQPMVKLATLALGLAVAAGASPSFAQSDLDTTNRAQAIRDCNVAAGKYIEHVWGNWPRQTYGACMSQRGQRE
jgi:hypothetical protein